MTNEEALKLKKGDIITYKDKEYIFEEVVVVELRFKRNNLSNNYLTISPDLIDTDTLKRIKE